MTTDTAGRGGMGSLLSWMMGEGLGSIHAKANAWNHLVYLQVNLNSHFFLSKSEDESVLCRACAKIRHEDLLMDEAVKRWKGEG